MAPQPPPLEPHASANELADAHVDLEALWGNSAIELRERLCEAKTSTERFDLLEEALLAHLLLGLIAMALSGLALIRSRANSDPAMVK